MEDRIEPLQLLTLHDAAELLQLSSRTLQRMIHRKDLPAFKVGAQWRIDEKALVKWLQNIQDER
jgi:excisionase family DNA binding protein